MNYPREMLHFHEETAHSLSCSLFFFCDILLIPEGEMFYLLTLLHVEVRGQGQPKSSAEERRDSVSSEGHFSRCWLPQGH